jgi:hypothetical protein
MPVGKRKTKLYIDTQPAHPFGVAGGDAGSAGGVDGGAVPAPPTIPAPTLTSLTAQLEQSAVTPSASITAVWTNLETNDLETYRVQIATDSLFTLNLQTYATGQNQNSALIGNRAISATYYVRVATVVGDTISAWSNVLSVATPADTTVPGVPTSPVGAFGGVGDFVVTWVNPTSANFRDVEITIRASSGGTILATVYDASQRYVWPAGANLAATSGTGDPSLYAELRSRSWGAVFSSLVNTGLITKAVPATPTVTMVRGATQVLAASISSARGVDVARYEFVFKRDGTTVATKLTTNAVELYELSGASDAGSHSWTVVARAQDGLNQYSAASSASSAIVMDVMTIEYLRAGLLFTDSDANSQATLDVLKDAVTASGGQSYAA